MGSQKEVETPLRSCRALDLTDDRGFLCGKILAEFGVDVVKVENPGGDSSRNLGPFYHNERDIEKSLLWWAFNSSKRGITLDITKKEGCEIFHTLVKSADFVVESSQPGYMAKLGLSYRDLSNVNPGLIMISISGFGQDGPYAQYKAPDIVCMAMGGYMNLVGDPDRPPVRISVPQSYLHASAQGAVGGLLAFWHRTMTGEGQLVDVSAQEWIAWAGFFNQYMWDMSRSNVRRLGNRRAYGPVGSEFTIPCIFQCKDGYVLFVMISGVQTRQNRKLVEWMEEEGMVNGLLKEINWETVSPFDILPKQRLELLHSFEAFFLTKNKAELLEQATSRGFLLAPLNSIRDIFESRQLQARGFWQIVEHPEVSDKVVYPGTPYMAQGCRYKIRRRAPLVGEHNDEIFRQELGLSKEQIIGLQKAGII